MSTKPTDPDQPDQELPDTGLPDVPAVLPEPPDVAGALPDIDREPREPILDPRSALTGGIPYPLATDPVAEGAAAMQSIAQHFSGRGLGELLDGLTATAGTDVNTLTRTGHFAVHNGVNAPSSDWIIYDVVAFNLSYVVQEATHMLSSGYLGQRWVRQMISGGWTAWALSPPRILTGLVNSDGAVAAGIGFTSARMAAGIFDVTYTVPFLQAPSVTFLPLTAVMMIYSTVEWTQPGTFRAKMADSAGTGTDQQFSFQVIGT